MNQKENNMAQQTALEWLIEQCPRIETIVAYNILEQAKAMEKEQIVEANINGQKNPHFSLESRISEAEHYYNKTYSK